MSRMFPLLGSLLGSTPGRRRGGGVQGSFDFTTMSSAQLQEADWSWTRANAIYVPDSAGDYAEIASGVLAKSDLGVHCFGAFTNTEANSIATGLQTVSGIGLSPRVKALSASATTTTASQIPILYRVTPGECSFTIPVITSPGRKGTDDVIAGASLDANNQLLAIHEDADNNILLRLVTAGSTVGEVDLGIVGNNVYTVISGKIEYADGIGRLAGALEGMSEMVEATGSGIIPPAAFTRWTLGNDHSQAAATQFWGSVLGLRIN